MQVRNHLFLVLMLTVSCKTVPDQAQTTSAKKPLDYSGASTLGLNEELVLDNERQVFKQYASEFELIHRGQQDQNAQSMGTQNNLRGMHAKSHGCVEGQVKVMPAEPRYAIGLFSNPEAEYKVTARFSNASGLMTGDGERDLRGLAIKVIVPNLEQVEGTVAKGEHDFLFTNAPSHHAKDIVELMDFTKAFAAGGAQKASFLATHPFLAAKLISQTGGTVESLWSETYWGRAPFRFGNKKTVKFLIKPLQKITSASLQSDSGNSNDRLAQDLSAQLSLLSGNQKLRFGIFAQFQTDPQSEPVEDHSVEWKTGEVKLAEVSFGKQTPSLGASCENLKFHPWNVQKEHRPLGNMNRARRAIYEAAQEFRAKALAR